MVTLVEPTMHYLNQYKREELTKKNPDIFANAPSRVLAFINLCIYPYKFEMIYQSVKTQERISEKTFDCIKGVITGLLVLVHRKHKDVHVSVDEYVIDFIKFIKSDSVGDPVKFLLSMKAYMLRFMFLRGLQVSFGIDWRQMVTEALELKKAPTSSSFHTIFTNTYVRNLLRVYVVWKNYREQHDPDYEAGVNDLNTLLDNAAKFKTSLEREKLVFLFEYLQANLPSWSYTVRRKASWAIDTAQDGYAMINRQFTDYKYKQVQG